jgi:hypothetical protein
VRQEYNKRTLSLKSVGLNLISIIFYLSFLFAISEEIYDFAK